MKSHTKILAIALATISIFGVVAIADDKKYDELLSRALTELKSGRSDSASVFIEQAIASSRRETAQFNWSATSKLWCEAMLAAANPITVAECARSRVGAVSEMSNPQPSREEALAKRVELAQAYLGAALELIEDDTAINLGVELRIKSDLSCLDRYVADEGTLDCFLNHRF